MATATNAKLIEVIRLGNPWLIGHNVSRVVPVYVINNVVAPDFARDNRLQSVKDLAFDASAAITGSLSAAINVASDDYPDLQATTRGLLSPEQRIFQDHRNGGASEIGSLFPMIGGLTAPAASDDGLGKRVRELLERHRSDWQDRLAALMAPTEPRDPATAYAFTLLGRNAGRPELKKLPKRPSPLRGIDKSCASFLDNLLKVDPNENRVASIRRLAMGVYFVGVIRMVAGVVTDAGHDLPHVFIFCGMPPGKAADPLVRAASTSFTKWTQQSHAATAERLYSVLKDAPVLPKTPRMEKLRQQIRGLLATTLGDRSLDGTMQALETIVDGNELTLDWCKRSLESSVLGLSKGELAKRVRSLGANIGFAGPDRGLMPRLMIDTPLLGVIARGIAGNDSMPFEDFVTRLSEQFGLIVGVGSDDAVVDFLGDLGSEGFDSYELLQKNQELLRERMIRTGLARSYSDSHTEVFGHA